MKRETHRFNPSGPLVRHRRVDWPLTAFIVLSAALTAFLILCAAKAVR